MTLFGGMLYMILNALLAVFSSSRNGVTPPYNQALAVVMFNATLPANKFIVLGDDFYTNTLKLNDHQRTKFEVKAMNYFRTKFGLVNPKRNPSLYTMLYSTNPQANMRCVVLSGESAMPADGYPFLDGGWLVTVINPAGITLGGEFDGMHAPAGTIFSIGHYVIERPSNVSTIWQYQHLAPGIVANQSVGQHISGSEIQIVSEQWGTGLALPITRYRVFSPQRAESIFRMVVTF